mgnify:CR=1 FL=1
MGPHQQTEDIFNIAKYPTQCYSQVVAITIFETSDFERQIEKLISKNKLSKDDFNDFKKNLAINPEQGDLIIGTGGIRKARLKSSNKGKSGGFRVCYLYLDNRLFLFLLFIYSKNEQSGLLPKEKSLLKTISDSIKKRIKNEQII